MPYIQAEMKQPECKEDEGLQKIETAEVIFCDHTATVCTWCSSQWMQDYILYWDRTEAGRKMKETIDADR